MTKTAEIIKKVCLVGTGGVGKTSLIKRFILDIFDDKYLKTLGTKVSKKELTLDYPEKDLKVNLTMLIWDIMGQETFRALLQDSYFYGAGGCLAVCDVTRPETLNALDEWVGSLARIAGDVPLIFLANKSDLTDSIKVEEDILKEYAEKHEAPYLYTSARTGSNVEEAFLKLGKWMTSDII
ncbi:MAG: GTP-binding protein [Thermoplasmata archaeon]|nr:MAG: GTP-binding protein [Thermoplasmata archaeon]